VSATSARFATRTQTNPIELAKGILSFPKSARILRSADFRKVYAEGFRVSGPYFAAFCLRRQEPESSRVGLTLPRALGNSAVRNRLKRRIREAIRLQLRSLEPGWEIVINPRRAGLLAPFQDLSREVERLFSRCRNS
jgi:ribonuclease P protein component